MAHLSLTRRVEILEQTVESLKDLPGRMTAVESQIVQLRDEMRGGFSALDDLRLEMRAMHYETLTRFDGVDKRLDGVDQRLDGVDQRLDGVDKRLDGVDKRLDSLDRRLDVQDMRFEAQAEKFEGHFDDLKRRMHVLHEDSIERIARSHEGRP